MHERNEGENKPQPQWGEMQTNPARWTGGETFSAVLQEVSDGDERRFSVQVSDGKELVVFEFRNSVRSFGTVFLAPDSAPPPPRTEPPEAAVPPAHTEVSHQQQQETAKKPVKIEGTIRNVDALRKTQKRQQPMLLFTVYDDINQTERRAVAFDHIAERLAAPETQLQPNEPITLFAWRHENTVHIRGKQTRVEDWYVQRAVYKGNVYEKPKPAGKKGAERRR